MGMSLKAYSKEQFPGLHAAVEKALAKERAERGLTGNEKQITYVANIRILNKIKTIRENDVNLFIGLVYTIQRQFPCVPIDLYTITEPASV